jgi:hypothetical protein
MADAAERYSKEQSRLKAEFDGADDDVTITAPAEPEVNPEIYKDVEPILFRGFLTLPAQINGVSFVFKSMNHHEFALLRFYGGSDDVVPSEFWGTFLAYGVFIVSGVNILPERERWITKLTELFNGLPTDAIARMVRYLSEINRRASVAIHLTEAYAMEVMSRYRWMQLKGLDLTSVAVTGIDGTQRLGLNVAQQVWQAINHIEDRNETYEREWEYSKFVGSCFAGKGIQKVYNQDSARRRQEREDRMTRKDKVLRQWVLGEDVEDGIVKGPGVVMAVARTVEELTTQLEHDIRGEKDWHDRVVEDHEARIRSGHLQRRQQLEQAALDNMALYPERGVLGVGSLDGGALTQAEVEERVRRRKQLMAQEVARMQVDPRADEKTVNFVDRWWGNEVSSEIATTDRDTSGAVPISQPRPPTTPFRRK